MNIDLLHYSSPPVVGGVESVIAHHARLMANAGHTVRILAGRGEAFNTRIAFITLPMADSRHEVILDAKRQLDRGQLPSNFNQLRDELHAQLIETTLNTDLLIAHNVCSLHKNLPLTAAIHSLSQRGGSPELILWHHDLAWTTPRYQAELHGGYPWDLLRRDWPPATQVVVSELRRKELSDLLGVALDRIIVVSNGLDLAQFLKLEERTRALLGQLDLLVADPLLLLPVRITPRKNIELALHILAAMKTYFPAVRLVITGPLGPHNPANVEYFQRLLSLRADLRLQKTVHFLAEISSDYLPDGVIADFYHLADGLLFPSREEGFGIPILEAGISGLPIFCADIPPLRELAGEHAQYFSPDANPLQVAMIIRDRLIADSNYLLRVTVRKKFTWERLYQEQIEPLLQKAGGQ